MVRRLLRSLVAIVLTLPLLVAAPTPSASAYFRLPCLSSGLPVKWPTTAIRYSAFGGTYSASIVAARNAWNSAQSSASLTVVSPTSGNPHFNVVIANYGNAMASGITRKPGTVDGYPGCSGSSWTTGQMETVTNTYWGVTAFRLQNTTVHEIGHALGLAHNSATFQCNGGPGLGFYAIMYPSLSSGSGPCKINIPQSDDANGVNAIY